jgi:UMF1 family MFS transporter
MLGEAIVATFLPNLASKRNMGVISGLGWGLGYIGGLLSMAVVSLFIITANPQTDLALYIQQHQWAMLAIALYFFVFSLPTFIWLKEHPQPSAKRLVQSRWQQSFNFRTIALQQPELMRFLWAFLFYMAGVQTVIKFIGIFTSVELGLSLDDLLVVFLTTQISAMFGAIGFGFVERWLGARPTLLITIGLWLIAIIAMMFLQDLADWFQRTPAQVFTVVALLAGTGIGSIQASSRSLVGQLAQDARAGSAFGLWGFFMRAAAILAAGFGVVADVFSRQQALWLVVAFLVVGALLLLRVPLSREQTQRQ